MSTRIFALSLALALTAAGGDLQPSMAQKDAVLLQNDFSQPGPLPPGVWQPRQHTRWAAADGLFHGRESSPEFQASQSHHQGLEPRLMIRNLPDEYIIEYSFRINSGKYTPIGAFLEFGHHMARVSFLSDGAMLTFGGLRDRVVLDSKPGFRLEPGHWYHVLGEVKGKEVLITIEDGPTFYGNHAGIADQKDGFGVCGLRGGTMDLDNVTIWSVQPELQRSWSGTRSRLASAAGDPTPKR